MILLVHMLFGAAVGYKTYSLTGSIWLSLTLALLSHYFLDLFPHVEYLKSAESLGKRIKSDKFKSYFFDLLKVLLDFLIGLALLFLLSKNQIIIYLFAILAIIPDGLTVINSLFKNTILKRHQELHGEKIQYLTKNKKLSKFWRVFTQVIAVLISVIVLELGE
ncbi:MAG: hypothetical protein AAB340_01190 [Patescibacteria group bacterium]